MAIYNPDIPLTFVHIPKTAGSSVSQWLKMYTNATDYMPLSFGSKHWEFSKVRKHMRSRRLNPGILVVVVRNPWDRLVSTWAYYLRREKSWCPENFRDFVLNTSWGNAKRLQTSFFTPSETIVLRFENLKQDFKQIQELCNCNEPLPWVNTSQHDAYTSMYDEEMIEEVRRRASADVVKLGYEYGNTLP